MPLARRKSSRKSGDRRNELTMQERYLDVKDFWLKQSEARQKELLHVPIRALLQGLCRSSTCPYFIRMTMCIRNIRNLLYDAPDAHWAHVSLCSVCQLQAATFIMACAVCCIKLGWAFIHGCDSVVVKSMLALSQVSRWSTAWPQQRRWSMGWAL